MSEVENPSTRTPQQKQSAADAETPKEPIRVKLLSDYRFLVTYPGHEDAPLLMDEPEPLGAASGPNASAVLASAVGNCLSASLLYCLRRARIEVEDLETSVMLQQGRNEHGRLRITGMDVVVKPTIASRSGRVDRCLEIFEDFCVVTESVRNGIDVSVNVEIDGPSIDGPNIGPNIDGPGEGAPNFSGPSNPALGDGEAHDS
jgi:uncharacterized OsmC-like protein